MKTKLIPLMLCMGLHYCATAQSPSIAMSSQNKTPEFDGLRGYFDYHAAASNTINVNFSLSPRVPEKTLHFILQTPDPIAFWAEIRDWNGKTVYTWHPKFLNYAYVEDWDISKFGPGNYGLDVFVDGLPNSIKHFDFSKK